MLYFWILTEGDQWIRNIFKKSLKVITETRSFCVQTYFLVFLHKRLYVLVQVKCLIPRCVAEMIMQLLLYCTLFNEWLLGRLGTLRSRRNRLQFKETLELQSKGLTSSGVSVLAGRTRFLSHV